jgi:hypothetical protein
LFLIGGLECVGYSSVVHFVFLRDVWIQTQLYQLSHPSPWLPYYVKLQQFFACLIAASTSLGAAHQALNIAKEHLKVKINK